jgi:hypothetical protein
LTQKTFLSPNPDNPEPNRKIKGNRTRIKSDLSGFSRILKQKKERLKICVNPLDPRHPRSIAVEVTKSKATKGVFHEKTNCNSLLSPVGPVSHVGGVCRGKADDLYFNEGKYDGQAA